MEILSNFLSTAAWWLIVLRDSILLVIILGLGIYGYRKVYKLIETKIPTRLDPKNRLAEMRAGNVVSVGLRAKSELGD